MASDGLQGASSQELGKQLLKALHRRPADVLTRGQQSLHLRLQHRRQSPVLPPQIQQRNRLFRHGARPSPSLFVAYRLGRSELE